MITQLKRGLYQFIETTAAAKVLVLGETPYEWSDASNYQSMLMLSHHPYTVREVSEAGHYYLYDVDHEESRVNMEHLELEASDHTWKGYLLPDGLPFYLYERARLIATTELLSNSRNHLRSWPQRLKKNMFERPQLRGMGI